MALTRRALLAQGLGGLAIAATRPWPVLAAPAPRKLALLVGLNRVARPDLAPLQGCHSDLALVRQLLVEGCGFLPNDILFLTDAQASRLAIESAILGHLGQAGPVDCVYFHFSGYGRMIPGPQGGSPEPALVTADSRDGDLNDLPLSLLWLLFRSLRTERAIACLDTGFVPRRDLPAALRQRATEPGRGTWSDELQLARQRLLNRVGQRATGATAAGPAGTVLWGAQPDQPALELRWDGLDAGLFTAALCQQAWSRGLGPAQPKRWRDATALAMVRLLGLTQQPRRQGRFKPQPGFGAPPPCDAWRVDSPQPGQRLWLGGVAADLLVWQGRGSRYTAQVGLGGHQGYWGRTEIETDSPPALLERQRCLPPDQILALQLGDRLSRIERVELASQLASLRERVSLTDESGAWDLQLDVRPEGGYRLLGRGLGPLTDPADPQALFQWLEPRLSDLLLYRSLRQIQNDGPGALALRVTLQPGLTGGLGGLSGPRGPKDEVGVVPVLALGTPVQLRLENPSVGPLHWLLLGFDGQGHCRWHSLPSPAVDDQRLEAGQTLDLTDETWTLESPGLGLVWAIATDQPLAQVSALATDATPLAIADALRADLTTPGSRSRCLDLERYAAFPLAWRCAR